MIGLSATDVSTGLSMSTTRATQTTILRSESTPTLPISQSSIEDQASLSCAGGASASPPSPGGASASVGSRTILERLPEKQKDLLEGVINRFRALDFSFDVKLFKRARDVDISQDMTAGIQASTSAHETSGVPPVVYIQSPTDDFDAGPSSYSTNLTPKAASVTLPEDPQVQDPTSPTYLARKIQTLLGTLPLPDNDSHLHEQPLPLPSPLLSTITTPPNSPLFTTVPTPPSSADPPRCQTRPTPRHEPQLQPQLPADSTPVANTELIELLSSATIMNGSNSRGKRMSVWSVLEDLKAPKGWPRNQDRSPSHKEGGGDVANEVDATLGNRGRLGHTVEAEENGDAFSDGSSVMMYSPLMPTTSSLVELAETEFMPMSVVGEDPSFSSGSGGSESRRSGSPSPATEEGAQSTFALQENGGGNPWMNVWPFKAWRSKVEEDRKLNSEATPGTKQEDKQTMTDPGSGVQPIAGPSSTSRTTYTMGADPAQGGNYPPLASSFGRGPADNQATRRPPRFRVQGQHRWVPSTTQLSFEARWWGYRMYVSCFSVSQYPPQPKLCRYLPPPVLAILSDRQLEATKRTALITTALTWFFSNIPIDVLPQAMRPAVVLLKTLVPCVGYIGTFISWSWATAMGYDEGGLLSFLPISPDSYGSLQPRVWHHIDSDMAPPCCTHPWYVERARFSTFIARTVGTADPALRLS